MWKYQPLALSALVALTYAKVSLAESITVPMNLTSGGAIGTVTMKDTEYGLLLSPNLSQLMPGIYGFHIHENPDCGPGIKDGEVTLGLAAGGHYDPTNTGSHQGPYGDGHLGDLPPLLVTQDGNTSTPILAPRLKQADVKGRSIMVHMMGDNFSDEPKPLGGGGARLACGIIP